MRRRIYHHCITMLFRQKDHGGGKRWIVGHLELDSFAARVWEHTCIGE